MKKIIIILAVILTSALTGLAITRSSGESVGVKKNIETISLGSQSVATHHANNLANAD